MREEKKPRVIITDFDGVLVDSYSCLPELYEDIARIAGVGSRHIGEFVAIAIEMEDEEDARENYDRSSWWPRLFRKFGIKVQPSMLRFLLERFWDQRIKLSRILPRVIETLEELRRRGIITIILAGNDGIVGLKRRRVERSGLSAYFDKILIVGDNVSDRISAVRDISKTYNVCPQEIVYVDDKPRPIMEVKRLPGIITVWVRFRGILKKAWLGDPKPTYTVSGFWEILSIFRR